MKNRGRVRCEQWGSEQRAGKSEQGPEGDRLTAESEKPIPGLPSQL
jgi:hypothetical protein